MSKCERNDRRYETDYKETKVGEKERNRSSQANGSLDSQMAIVKDSWLDGPHSRFEAALAASSTV